MSPLIGRRRELRQARQLLEQTRLLTLTGVGGVGKTRLAVRLAATLRRAFPDGVWFVDLAAVRAPERVPQTVLGALGMQAESGASPLSALADGLRDRRALLVLDNCEHVIGMAAKTAATVLSAAARVRILATSRESMGLAGEQVMPLELLSAPPMGVPECGSGELSRRYDAVALFEERARAAAPDFALTGDNYLTVARLCHRLEGLPLAIELAAIRLRGLGLVELERRLDDPFRLLASTRHRGERHSSLRAAVQWSYDLCTQAEKHVWARASVFAGPFDLAAADYICGCDEVPAELVWEVIDTLVSKSVLVSDSVGKDCRYRLLDALRDYGRLRLREAGKTAAMRRRHRDWYLRMAERCAAESAGSRQIEWLRSLPAHHPNLRAALEFCATEPGEGQTGLRMVCALWFYWLGRGLHTEVLHWIDRLLPTAPEPTTTRAETLWWATFFAHQRNDVATTRKHARACAELAGQLSDDYVTGLAALAIAYEATDEGDYPRAERLAEAAAATLDGVARPTGPSAIHPYSAAAFAAATQGEYARAEGWIARARATAAKTGERYCLSFALYLIATSRQQNGAHAAAAQLAGECMNLQREFADTRAVLTIELLSWIAASTRNWERAAVLMGAADHLGETFGAGALPLPRIAEPRAATCARVRDALGEPAFQAAVARGRQLDLAQTVAYALEEPHHASPAPADTESGSPLTRREQQVAQLVAAGLSNREIATQLVISQRTAESHVEHILAKLNLASRVQIAGWAFRQPGDP